MFDAVARELDGVAAKLAAQAGGKVTEDVKAGRTAQQGENTLNNLPDSAPSTFVISLAEDDTSSASVQSATNGIQEFSITMRFRTT